MPLFAGEAIDISAAAAGVAVSESAASMAGAAASLFKYGMGRSLLFSHPHLMRFV